MKINSIIYKVFIMLVWINIFSIQTKLVIGQTEGEKITKGSYYLHRFPTQKLFITGVSLDELTKYHFKHMDIVDIGLKGRWGRCFTLFDKKSKNQIEITLAVYGSIQESEDSVLDLLNDISVVFEPGSKSGDVVGTHSWFSVSPKGSGTLIFTYHNSLIQLFSTDYNLVEPTVSDIMEDFKSGKNGVRLGVKIQLPEIRGVSISEEVRFKKSAFITIDSEDPLKQKLDYVIISTSGQFIKTDENNRKIFLPSRIGSGEIKIYAINSLNIVSQVYIKKIEINK